MFDVSPPSPIHLSPLDNYGLMKELTHASATLVSSSVAKAFVIHLSQPTRTCSCGAWQLGLDTHLPLSDLPKLLLTVCTHHRPMTQQLKCLDQCSFTLNHCPPKTITVHLWFFSCLRARGVISRTSAVAMETLWKQFAEPY